MRMAKPSARDIDAGGDLMQILSTIDTRFGGPWETEEGPDSLEEALGGEDFDCDDPAHLRGLYNSLAALMRKAPGFHYRVIGGMCYVICYDKNKILDPDDNCIGLHPDLQQGLQLLAEHRASADFIPRMEREARAAVAELIEQSAAQHLTEMNANTHWISHDTGGI